MKDKPIKKIKLLFVDDELEFLRATSGPLTRRGFIVTEAQNGHKALELIASQSFDVVVLDVKMPGIDGVDVFARIKEIAPDLPVIMLTGHGTVKQAFETSRGGVFEYLSKPCDIDKLAGIAIHAVEQRREHQNLIEKPKKLDSKIRLLFVDDEIDFLNALSDSLSRRGMVVTTAKNAVDAIRILKDQSFDVALIDLKMPGPSGIKLLSHIKTLEDKLPVIILTGQSSMGDIVRAVQEGVFDILSKPQDVDDLVQRIVDAFHFKQNLIKEQQKRKVKEILENNPD